MGCETAIRDGRIIVTKIVRGSSASKAGLQVDDELIALGGHRLPKENWKDRLQCHRTDQELTATIARRGRIGELQLRLQPRCSRKLESVSEPTAAQTKRQKAWLFG
ncbi:MAG: PDZ domain-containing protein [Pirellulaceae bacterium]|nr:PDZ domain-containing protein [Pirellulaceae bacterium]